MMPDRQKTQWGVKADSGAEDADIEVSMDEGPELPLVDYPPLVLRHLGSEDHEAALAVLNKYRSVLAEKKEKGGSLSEEEIVQISRIKIFFPLEIEKLQKLKKSKRAVGKKIRKGLQLAIEELEELAPEQPSSGESEHILDFSSATRSMDGDNPLGLFNDEPEETEEDREAIETGMKEREAELEAELERQRLEAEADAAAPTQLDNQLMLSEDELYQWAIEVVRGSGIAVAANISRNLHIPHHQALKMIERMEEEGIVSKVEDNWGREVLKQPPVKEETGEKSETELVAEAEPVHELTKKKESIEKFTKNPEQVSELKEIPNSFFEAFEQLLDDDKKELIMLAYDAMDPEVTEDHYPEIYDLRQSLKNYFPETYNALPNEFGKDDLEPHLNKLETILQPLMS